MTLDIAWFFQPSGLIHEIVSRNRQSHQQQILRICCEIPTFEIGQLVTTMTQSSFSNNLCGLSNNTEPTLSLGQNYWRR